MQKRPGKPQKLRRFGNKGPTKVPPAVSGPWRMSASPTCEHVPSVRGIYRITCVPMRKHYIGQSVDFARRWLDHQVKLWQGAHSNRALQAAFNHYGPQAFTFAVMEYVHGRDRDELSLAEQRWMDRHVAKFNVRPAGDDNFIAWRASRKARRDKERRAAHAADQAADEKGPGESPYAG